MTREEAIKILNTVLFFGKCNCLKEEIEECLQMAIKALEQESVLDKVRNEIAEYGSIWVAYAITGHSDRDIENLIEGVLKQAKEQVLNIIDKYKLESEDKE